MLGPFACTSPSSAIRIDTPVMGKPADPIRILSGKLAVRMGEVSVRPYPTAHLIPIPLKNLMIVG